MSGAAALTYSVTNLTLLLEIQQEPWHFGQALGLNNSGDIVVRDTEYNQTSGHPYRTTTTVAHKDGTTTAIPVPYQRGFVAEVALNNLGEVAALVFPDRDNIDLTTREVWVYTAAGVPTKLEGLTGMENLSFNDHGQVAVSNTDEDRAFRYTPGIGWEDLGSLANDGFAVPRALNNAGAVVGGTSLGSSLTITPFLYRDGTGMENVPTPFGLGRAINDNFVVTGDGGFVWYAKEQRMDYIFNNQALGFIRPNDINLLGQIVGTTAGAGTGFYWDEADGRQLLSDALEDPIWHIPDAYAINDEEWILAVGTPRFDQNGPGAYLLLRPVPEPGAGLLVLATAGRLFYRRRGRSARHP